jgi:hypothetical protein
MSYITTFITMGIRGFRIRLGVGEQEQELELQEESGK